MKKLNAILSLFLAITLICIVIPFSRVSANTDTDYTIFKADPLKLGDVGINATTDVTDKSWIRENVSSVTTGDDGGVGTYKVSRTFSGETGVKYGMTVFNSGFTSADIAWIGDEAVLNALSGMVTLSMDVRLTGTASGDIPLSGYDSNVVLFPLDKTTMRSYNNYQYWNELGKFKMAPVVKADNTWTSISVTPATNAMRNFASGSFIIQIPLKADNLNTTATWEFKNVEIKINSANKDAINTALETAGSTWTFDSLVEAYANAKVYKEYTIYKSNSAMFGVQGVKATSDDLTDSSNKRDGEFYTGADNSFKWTKTLTNTGVGFYYTSFKMGYTSEDIPWIADSEVLNALAGKIKLSFKARLTGDDLPSSGYDSTIWVYPFDKTNSRTSFWSNIIKTSSVGKADGWKTLEVTYANAFTPFASGEFFIQASLKGANVTKPVNWEIADVTFTISEKDKDAIDAALSAAGSEWTFNSIVSEYTDSITDRPLESMYVVWDADPDKYAMPLGGNANATDYKNQDISAVDVVKAYDENSSYFHTQYDYSASPTTTSKKAIVDGYNYKEYTYGWLQIPEIMNAVVKYGYAAGDYCVSGTNVPNGNIYFGFAGKYSNNVGKADIVWSSYKVNEWGTTGYKKINTPTEAINNTWYYSNWRFHLYSGTQYSEIVNVDVRSFRLALKERDRLNFNAELKDIVLDENNMKYLLLDGTLGVDENGNTDYFQLLIRHDKESSYGQKTLNEHKINLAGSSNNAICDTFLDATRYSEGDIVKVNTNIKYGYGVINFAVKDKNNNAVETIVDEVNSIYGFKMPDSDVTVYSTLSTDIRGDINTDEELNIADLVSFKKILISSEPNSSANITLCDFDDSDSVSGSDLSVLRYALLEETSLYPYYKIEVPDFEPDLPGASAEDKNFTISVKNRLSQEVDSGKYTLTCENSNVVINGNSIIVPYAVRQNGSITLKVVNNSNQNRMGIYTLKFPV